jgi:DHA1 family bicyclomycin/chloramphenicol resistance-like MFS transporter
MKDRIGLLVVLIVGLMAIAYSSAGIYSPSMPAIAQSLGATVGEVQFTFSAYIAAFAFGQLIYGPLSDRWGRRLPLLVGLGIYILGSVACAFATSAGELLLARGLQALGGCAGPTLARAMVRDLFPRDEAARVMSYVGMVMAVAPALAPVAGGYLQVEFGWPSIFYALTVVGGIVLALNLLLLEETHRSPPRHAGRGLLHMVMSYPQFMRSARFMGYSLNTGFSMATAFVYVPAAPFVLIELIGVSPDRFGWYAAIPVTFNFAGAFIGARLTTRLGGDRMVVLGAAITAVAGLAMLGFVLAGVLTVATVVGPMCLVTMGASIMFPSSSQGAIGLFPDRAGTASSLNGFLQMALAAVASVGLGFLPQTTALPMAAMVAGCAVATLAVLVLLRRGPKPPSERGSHSNAS